MLHRPVELAPVIGNVGNGTRTWSVTTWLSSRLSVQVMLFFGLIDIRCVSLLVYLQSIYLFGSDTGIVRQNLQKRSKIRETVLLQLVGVQYFQSLIAPFSAWRAPFRLLLAKTAKRKRVEVNHRLGQKPHRRHPVTLLPHYLSA